MVCSRLRSAADDLAPSVVLALSSFGVAAGFDSTGLARVLVAGAVSALTSATTSGCEGSFLSASVVSGGVSLLTRAVATAAAARATVQSRESWRILMQLLETRLAKRS